MSDDETETRQSTPHFPPGWGQVNGKPFDAPLPFFDGRPIDLGEEWMLPPEMRGNPSARPAPRKKRARRDRMIPAETATAAGPRSLGDTESAGEILRNRTERSDEHW